jgi:integrase
MCYGETMTTLSTAWTGPTGEKGIRRAIINGRPRFIVQMGGRGKGHRRAKICPTLEEALALKRQWLAEGVPVQGAPIAPPLPVTTVRDGLREYVADLVKRSKNPESIKRVKALVPALERDYPELLPRPVDEVSGDDLYAFRRRREARHIKPHTIVRDLRVLRAMLRLTRQTPLPIDAGVFPAAPTTRTRELTPRQESGALMACPEPFRTMYRLKVLLFLRRQDLVRMRREWIRLDESVLEIPQTKTGPEQVALSAAAIALLRPVLEGQDSPWVFPNVERRDRGPYSKDYVSYIWRRAIRAQGRRDFTLHDLKHHAAMRALAEGATFPELQALGHWKDPKMVNRYATASSARLRALQDRIQLGGRRHAAGRRP